MSGTIYANVVLPNGSSVSVAKTVSIGAPSITSVSGPDQVGAGGSASFTASLYLWKTKGIINGWSVQTRLACLPIGIQTVLPSPHQELILWAVVQPALVEHPGLM